MKKLTKIKWLIFTPFILFVFNLVAPLFISYNVLNIILGVTGIVWTITSVILLAQIILSKLTIKLN